MFGLETFKCKIPEYLHSLPKISKNSPRYHQININTPKTLVEECCKALESVKILSSITPFWDTMDIISYPTSEIETDSYRKLCHIKHPLKATQFIIIKSESLGMTPCEYLDSIKLIRRETLTMSNNERLIRHWEKLTEDHCEPRILFGRVKKKR